MNLVYTISNHFKIIPQGRSYYSPFYRWWNWDSERPCNLFKVTQLDLNPALPELKICAFSSLMCASCWTFLEGQILAAAKGKEFIHSFIPSCLQSTNVCEALWHMLSGSPPFPLRPYQYSTHNPTLSAGIHKSFLEDFLWPLEPALLMDRMAGWQSWRLPSPWEQPSVPDGS